MRIFHHLIMISNITNLFHELELIPKLPYPVLLHLEMERSDKKLKQKIGTKKTSMALIITYNHDMR